MPDSLLSGSLPLERFLRQGQAVLLRSRPGRVYRMDEIGGCHGAAAWVSAMGNSWGVGDEGPCFTLMSAIKPFLLLRLLELQGAARVAQWVGDDPSLLPYYSLEQLEADGGKPRNAMINSGAMLLASHLPGTGPREQEQGFAEWLSGFAPGAPLIPDAACLARVLEGDSANQALAQALECSGRVASAAAAYEVYFRLCCLAGTVRAVASLGEALAVSRSIHRNRVLRTMAQCGLYEASGEWFKSTGLPAKSGVSGVMFGVWPDQGCVAVCSPWLDAGGNPIVPQVVLAEAAAFCRPRGLEITD